MLLHEFTSSLSCLPNLQFCSYICFSSMTFDQPKVSMLLFSLFSLLYKIPTISCSGSGARSSASPAVRGKCFSITATAAERLASAEVSLALFLGKKLQFLIIMEAKKFRLGRSSRKQYIGIPGFGQRSRESQRREVRQKREVASSKKKLKKIYKTKTKNKQTTLGSSSTEKIRLVES